MSPSRCALLYLLSILNCLYTEPKSQSLLLPENPEQTPPGMPPWQALHRAGLGSVSPQVTPQAIPGCPTANLRF